MIIELAEDISKKAFEILLNFFYTGIPLFSDGVTDREINDVLHIAEVFEIPELQAICSNIKTEQTSLNASIGITCNNETC
jgi:hypothetical protein